MSIDPALRRNIRRPALLTLIAIALTLAVTASHVIRAFHAGALWRDEAAAVRLATLPDLREITALFQHEAFPLLFPLTVRGFTAVAGTGDAALRTFGLLVGFGLLALLWLNARASAGSVPIASLVLAGFNLPILIYGDSIRGYGLGAILILSVYGLLALLLREPLSRRRHYAAALLPFAAVACVQVLFGNTALLFALGIAAGTIAATRRRWGIAAWILGSCAVAGLSLIPYVPALTGARRDWSVIVTYPFDGHRIWYAFMDALGRRPVLLSWLMFLGLAVAEVLQAMRNLRVRGAPASSRPVRRHPAGGSTSKLEVSALETGNASLAPNALFAALVFLFSPLATGIFLGLLGYRPRDWYYLPLIALLASAADTLLGISRAWRPWIDGAVACALVMAACVQVRPLTERLTPPASNAGLVARHVAAVATRDDLVVVIPWYYGVSFDRYYRGSAEWLTLPVIADHRIHRYDLLKPRLASERPIDDLMAAVASHLRAGHRVWVVGDFEPQPQGRRVVPMPPAPHSDDGWHDRPYIENWTLQFEAFVTGHSRRTTRVAVVPAVEASRLENMSLFEVEGWAEER